MRWLNKEEFLTGFIVGTIATFWCNMWWLLAGPLCGLLWALGGSGFLGTKLWRRLGVPVIIVAIYLRTTHHWVSMISIPLGWLVLCIGYGTPFQDDKPSSLGKFFWDKTKGKQPLTDILTRGTLLCLFLLSLWIPLAF